MKTGDFLLALCVPLSWGLGFTFAKAGLSEFPPLFLMGMRFCLAALVLVWFVPVPREHLKRIFWIALVGSTIQYGLTFTGLSMIDASLAIIIVHLEVPFAVILAAVILKEKPGLQRLFGMLISFAGIALIAGQPNLQGQLLAVFLTASGAMMWALGQVMVKQLVEPPSGLTLTAWIGVFSGPQMIFGSMLLEQGQLESLFEASWIGWGAILYLGLIMTVMGYGIWYRVLSRNPVSQVIPVLLLLPVFTIASSVLFLDERPSMIVLLGGAVVIGGVSMIVISKDREPSSS
ncbi:MAG: EamA family transporter [SAR324 cluster bacterium]|nr:EamA family transporter [SAR324 cluster bacterium]